MASNTKSKAGGESPLKPVNLDAPADDAGLSKFTWNARGFNESLTIRTDDEEELKALRDKWKAVISPPRRKLPYMHSGDECLVEGCRGVMITRTGTNRKTQQPYNYLRCSAAPKCSFYAYIEDEKNTPEDAPQAAPVQPAQNGAANETATARS
jgi:hypothetical protein